MKSMVSAFTVAFIFAIGLGISGMTQPSKVIGFLDVFGNWDPSLLFVMLGSIFVHFIAYRIIRKRPHPLFSPKWHIPEKTQITRSLVFGSLLFGLGWGVAGYCPGPAIASLGSLQFRPLLFVVGLLIGMYAFKILDQKLKINR